MCFCACSVTPMQWCCGAGFVVGACGVMYLFMHDIHTIAVGGGGG